MEIRSVDVIRHPLDRVWTTFRDRLPDFTRYIPNVDRIEVQSREERTDGEVGLVNHWHAVSDIPAVARGVVKPEMLAWVDRAQWLLEPHRVQWAIEPFFLADHIRCEGLNHFKATDEATTEVRIEGVLEIDVGDLAFVPKPLRKRVGKEIERFIAGLITPNLGNAAKAVEQILDAE